MDTKNYFKDMYTDFFGVESLPKIEVKKEEENKGPQDFMASLFDKINELDISSDSKDLLKKIIEYMRKYNEKIETNYIPFRFIIEANNNKLTEDISNLLYDSGTYFNYISKDKEIISLYRLDKIDFNKGLIVLNELNGLNIEEDKNIKKFIHDLETYLNQDNKSITIIEGSN